MKLIEVKTPQDIRLFLELPVTLYKDEPNWVRPLDNDIESVFDKKKNKLFREAETEAIRWLLQNNSGKVIGRIAAFINPQTVHQNNDQATGGMGFFECINDKEAAFFLFDTAKKWLEERGMEAMDGPINLGDRNAWWGLLVEGFHQPNYLMPYHLPYYRDLFEDYGFEVYFKQYTYHRYISNRFEPSIYAKAKPIEKNPAYSFRTLEKNKLEKYALDFMKIYNGGWGKHPGVSQMTEAQAKTIMKVFKPILDPKIMVFGYHHEEPICCFLMIPELNDIFKHFNGNFNTKNPLHLLKYLLLKKRRAIKRTVGVLFGVTASHQRKGVEAALVCYYRRLCQKSYKIYPYKELEFNWIGDFNPKMMRVAEQVGGRIYKTHHTYRYLFDRSKPFERMKRIR